MSKPVAVLISDIHYSLQTLELADKSLRMAIQKANDLQVPLIIAGDLHDTKANLRGECVNALIKTLTDIGHIRVLILRGNHDQLNEKSTEHSLNFLKALPCVHLVETPGNIYSRHGNLGSVRSINAVPYCSNVQDAVNYLKTAPKNIPIIMHQGIQGSDAGHYIQDPTALAQADVAGLRVISGHYHRRQDITLPDGGLWSYIGNPYSLNFGESDHPEKGFRILNDDGTLDFVPTNLRKHVIYGLKCDSMGAIYSDQMFCSSDIVNEQDLKWVKIIGEKSGINRIRREAIEFILKIKDFRLDLNPLDTESKTSEVKTLTQHELLDSIIDNTTNTSDEAKTRVKQLWRNLCK